MATRQLVKLFKVAGKSVGQVALDPGVIHQPVQITGGRDQLQGDRSKSLHTLRNSLLRLPSSGVISPSCSSYTLAIIAGWKPSASSGRGVKAIRIFACVTVTRCMATIRREISNWLAGSTCRSRPKIFTFTG